jgi:hypothetical protein
MTLHIYQYSYFRITSRVVTGAEMADRIGLNADEVTVMGSRRADPRPMPRRHAWTVVCEEPGMRVDDSVERVIQRLLPFTDSISALVEDIAAQEGRDGTASLTVVRYLDHDERGQSGDWQHQLLGWNLDSRTLRFLADMHADIHVDEYGQDGRWWTAAWDRLEDLAHSQHLFWKRRAGTSNDR